VKLEVMREVDRLLACFLHESYSYPDLKFTPSEVRSLVCVDTLMYTRQV
jgi:hypothetical protein